MLIFSVSRTFVCLISITSHSSLYINFHILPQCELYSLLLSHKGTSVYLLPPTPDYWYTFFFLAGPHPLHETAVSAFSRSPLGHVNTFYCKCSSPCTLFFNATTVAFPFFISFLYFCLPPQNFSMDSMFPPTSSHTFSTTLSHLSPARHFVPFPHTALLAMAGNLFLGKFLAIYRYF